MAVNLNKVLLIGNLTRDPELRYTPQGTAVSNLRIAVNRNFKDRNGENKQETCFINVVTWSNLAEVCNQYLNKGRPVFVEGILQSRNWQDAQGNKRTVIEVRAERVQFLDRKPKSDSNVDLGQSPEEDDYRPDDSQEFAGSQEIAN
jgi:single-strand DNA-binding protein